MKAHLPLTRRSFLAGTTTTPIAAQLSAPLRLLVLTGGHGFEEEAFFQIFRDLKRIRFTHAEFRKGAESKLAPEAALEYDAMLFYDMNQDAEPHWTSWMQLLQKGMPSVFLHHALGSYAKVPAYLDVVGGRARFTLKAIPGEISTFFAHDQDMHIRIADPSHPITQGMEDFTIHDECYRGYYVRPDAHILLTTEHPKNNHEVAWTYQFGNSAIVYLQLGHDSVAYKNPNFRVLIERSIWWAVEATGATKG